jgi:hypothetical protein
LPAPPNAALTITVGSSSLGANILESEPSGLLSLIVLGGFNQRKSVTVILFMDVWVVNLRIAPLAQFKVVILHFCI